MKDLFGHSVPTTLEEGRAGALEQLRREWTSARRRHWRERSEASRNAVLRAREAYMGLLRYHHHHPGS